MAGEGMVAVMQGLRDCGLAVALLDEDGKTYTLVPKVVERKTTSTAALPSQCDAGAQATDGRYATVYKVHHCKVTPTSPPDDLPEFPPQRAEVYPGHGNFEVGGTGSAETYIPGKSSCYRGGMCWTDRGSVCSPRPSRDPDAFANSLRKYPISPDRSSEMVERLVNYSQHNNYNRPHRHYSPPCRTCDHTSNCSSRSSRHGYEPEVFVTRRQRSPEDYPTRERRAYEESYRKPTFSQNSDMRTVREISRRLKDSIKSMSLYVEAPITNTTRGKNELHPAQNPNPNFVNTEIQAAASMVSRKVCTVPQPQPIKRTVAVPLSPASSISRNDETGNVSIDPSISRSVQTLDRAELSVHTATCYTDVTNKVSITRKSESFSDFAIDKDLKTDILMWLDDDSDPKVKAIQDSVLRKLNCRLNKIPGFKVQRKEVKDNLKERKADQLHRMHSQSCYICKSADAIRNDANDIANDKSKDEAIKEWVNDIYVKTRDMLRPAIKEQVYNTFVRRLKHSAANKTAFHREQAITSEILVLLDDVPIDYQGLSKRIYLNTLVDALITKLDNISEELSEDNKFSNKSIHKLTPQSSKYYSESSVREIGLEPVKTATRTIVNALRETGTNFTDILTHSNNEDHSNKDNCKDEVAAILNNVTNLSEDKGVEFAMYLKENVKGKLIEKRLLIETRPKTVLVVHDTPKLKFRGTCGKNVPKVKNSINHEFLDSCRYMSQLSGQIEEWLSNLKIAQKYDKALRKAAVNDLANDIIDRQKYMEMSSNSCTDIDELEHLKYQIFKWINKLVGEDNTETIEHASELMQRIKNIPVSVVSTHNHETTTKCVCVGCRFRNSGKHNIYEKTHEDKSENVPDRYNFMPVNRCVQTVFTASNSQFNISEKAGPSESKNDSDLGNASNVNAMSSSRPCCQGPPTGPPSLKQLNDEFEAFVANWVKEIPMESNTPEESAMVERARLGIENGIWKAITKMKFEPATFHNKFLYEDVLEEEIDVLLDLLPQTPDLQQKRHLLKVKLIEKTSEINEKLLDAGMPASFKQQLAQQVASNLPRRAVNTNEEDPNKLFEEMLILCIADDFILSTRYKDEDKVKANAYRNKVIRKIEAIIDEVKRTSGKEVKDFDSELCVNDVISALHKVPLPTDETIRQEADEILLGLEIEQWFNDLPIVKNDERTEQLHRRRLRDALTKKLHEMEKEVNIADCTGEPKFKHEISMFLEKLPLEENESLNINFMVDKLANRMKNRDKGNRRKSVGFVDDQQEYGKPQAESTRLHASQGMKQPNISSQNLGHEFDAFTQYVPACSSMINQHPEPRNYHEPADYKKWGIDSNQSQKWYSFDSKGNPKDPSAPVYVPGQFQEETLGGRFGYGPQDQIPTTNQRSFNPGAVNHDPTMGSFSENQGNMQSSTPYQQGHSMNHHLTGYHSYPPQMNPAMASMYGQQMPRADIPSDEFFSLPYDSNPPPPMPSFVPTLPRDCSQRNAQPPVASFVDNRSANQGPAQVSFFDNQGNLKASTPYQQKPGPNMTPTQMNPAMGSMNNQQNMTSTNKFVSLPYASNPPMPNFGPTSQISQPSPSKSPESHPPVNSSVGEFANRSDISQNQSSTYQGASNFAMPELPSYRRYNEPLPQYEASGFSSTHDSKLQFASRSLGQSPHRSQFDSQSGSGFNKTQASACKNCSQPEISSAIAEQSFQPPHSFTNNLDATQQGRPNVTQADGSIRGPVYPSVNQSNQGQIDPNGSTNVQMTNQDSIQQRPQNRSLLQPLVTGTNASDPTFYGQGARFLAPNQSTGMSISNQPAGFSMPNQPVRNLQPPNIKEQRQIEKKSRGADSGTDDEGEEVRVRCQCVEKYNRRCKKRPLFTCDAWLDYPLHFPMGCACAHPYFYNGR